MFFVVVVVVRFGVISITGTIQVKKGKRKEGEGKGGIVFVYTAISIIVVRSKLKA